MNNACKKILIVDDEEETLEQLKNVLKRAGYEVFATAKGKEAFSLAKQNVPDVIILDALIPDESGSAIAKELSCDDATKEIPIILLSGLNTKEDERIIKEKTGSFHVLAKPITGPELVEAVKSVVG